MREPKLPPKRVYTGVALELVGHRCAVKFVPACVLVLQEVPGALNGVGHGGRRKLPKRNVDGAGLLQPKDLCAARQFELIRLSEENYYLSTAPIALQALPILLINLGTLIITLVFLLLPSYLVSNISPVKAIRFK